MSKPTCKHPALKNCCECKLLHACEVLDTRCFAVEDEVCSKHPGCVGCPATTRE